MWPMSLRETAKLFALALGAIYIANYTGLRQKVVG
jgi:hypothetical protein